MLRSCHARQRRSEVRVAPGSPRMQIITCRCGNEHSAPPMHSGQPVCRSASAAQNTKVLLFTNLERVPWFRTSSLDPPPPGGITPWRHAKTPPGGCATDVRHLGDPVLQEPASAGRKGGTPGFICCSREQWDKYSALTHQTAVFTPPHAPPHEYPRRIPAYNQLSWDTPADAVFCSLSLIKGQTEEALSHPGAHHSDCTAAMPVANPFEQSAQRRSSAHEVEGLAAKSGVCDSSSRRQSPLFRGHGNVQKPFVDMTALRL